MADDIFLLTLALILFMMNAASIFLNVESKVVGHRFDGGCLIFSGFGVASWYACHFYYVVEYIFDFLVDCLRRMLDYLNSYSITRCPFSVFVF